MVLFFGQIIIRQRERLLPILVKNVAWLHKNHFLYRYYPM